MDEELEKEEKVKVQQRRLKEAKGEETLEKSYPCGKEENRGKRRRRTPKCRNVNRPKQL